MVGAAGILGLKVTLLPLCHLLRDFLFACGRGLPVRASWLSFCSGLQPLPGTFCWRWAHAFRRFFVADGRRGGSLVDWQFSLTLGTLPTRRDDNRVQSWACK